MSGSARGRAQPKPRPAPRPAPRAAPRTAPRIAPGAGPLAGWRRWRWVALLVLAAVIGLPLAHALFGEAVALLGGTLLLGFLLGRWTAH